MTVTTQRRTDTYLERPRPSGLAEVVDIILDKGLVIDAFVRVSLVGIEILTIDARIVIASVDTYLRFAEATNRLDLYEKGGRDLFEVLEGGMESGAKGKTSGALEGVKESAGDAISDAKDALTGDEDDDGQEEGQEEEGQAQQQQRRPKKSTQRRRRQQA